MPSGDRSRYQLDRLDEAILRQIVHHVARSDQDAGKRATLLPLHRLALTCPTFYRIIWSEQTEEWWKETLAMQGYVAIQEHAAGDLGVHAQGGGIQVRAAREVCKHQENCEPGTELCPASQTLTIDDIYLWANRQKEFERVRDKVPKFLKAVAQWLGPVKPFLKLDEGVISMAQAKQMAIPFNRGALAAVLKYGQMDTRHCKLVDSMFTNPPLEQIEVAISLTSKLDSKLRGYNFTTFTVRSKQGVTLRGFLEAWFDHMWDGAMRNIYYELGWLDGNPDPVDCEIFWDIEKSLYDDKFASRINAKPTKWWPLFHFVNGGKMMMMVTLTT